MVLIEIKQNEINNKIRCCKNHLPVSKIPDNESYIFYDLVKKFCMSNKEEIGGKGKR